MTLAENASPRSAIIGPSCRLTAPACIADHILEHKEYRAESAVLINAMRAKSSSLMVLAAIVLHTAGKAKMAEDVSPISVETGKSY